MWNSIRDSSNFISVNLISFFRSQMSLKWSIKEARLNSDVSFFAFISAFIRRRGKRKDSLNHLSIGPQQKPWLLFLYRFLVEGRVKNVVIVCSHQIEPLSRAAADVSARNFTLKSWRKLPINYALKLQKKLVKNGSLIATITLTASDDWKIVRSLLFWAAEAISMTSKTRLRL